MRVCLACLCISKCVFTCMCALLRAGRRCQGGRGRGGGGLFKVEDGVAPIYIRTCHQTCFV